MRLFLSAAIFLAGFSTSGYGYIVHGFPAASAYNVNTATMDAALGVTGYRIENFEDASLISGFSIEYTHTGLGQLTSLPNVCPNIYCAVGFDNPNDPLYFRRNFPTHAWDGEHILYTPQPSNAESALILRFHNGASSVGVGLSDYNDKERHTWAINGIVMGEVANIPNFSQADSGRSTYMRVDAESGDAPITSVSFFHKVVYDALEYDHVAFLESPLPAVPEPETYVMLLAGLALLGSAIRRRKQA